MIGNIARNNNIFTYSRVQSRARNNDNVFSEALETTDSAEDTLLASAPDKWVTEPGISFNAVKKALEYKKSLGVEESEPTHELTAEQKDWLYSRHDLGSMQTYTSYSFVNDGGSTQYGVKATAEYSNFLADLAYLGVFSYDDLIQTSPLDTRPGGNSVLSGYVAEMQGSNYGLLDTARMSVEHLENMFSFYSERAMDPSRRRASSRISRTAPESSLRISGGSWGKVFLVEYIKECDDKLHSFSFSGLKNK